MAASTPSGAAARSPWRLLATLAVSSERVVLELTPRPKDGGEAPFIWTPDAGGIDAGAYCFLAAINPRRRQTVAGRSGGLGSTKSGR